MNQKIELRETESGDFVLCKNGRNCVCPFAGQQVMPLPNKLANDFVLQTFAKSCESSCPLFIYYPLSPGSDKVTVEIRCSPTEVHYTSTPVIPFKKKSNLSIH